MIKPHFTDNYLNAKLAAFGFTKKDKPSESRYIYRLKRHIIQESIYGVDIDASAIDIANDSDFGLSSAVYAATADDAIEIAKQLRTGQCFIQGGYFDLEAPFGGYKQSGNGREWGKEGLSEYLETKAIISPAT